MEKRSVVSRWFVVAMALIALSVHASERQFRLSSEVQSYSGWALGTTKPATEVTLTNEVAGLVAELPFEPGRRFSEGDVLVRFDCRLLQLQQRKSRSQQALKAEQFRVSQRLFELNSIGAEELAIATGELESAQVDLEIADYSVERCRILAPFDGVVAERNVDAFEYVEPRTPLLRIIQTDRIDVALNIPASNLASVLVGERVDVLFDSDQPPVKGQVHAISPEINPISQLVSVKIRISQPPLALKYGASVGVHLE